MIQEKKKALIVTANPETMMIGEREPAFDRLLCDARTVIVPDGIGVVKAAQKLTGRDTGRIAGVELAEFLIREAVQEGYRIYLYGAEEAVVSTLARKIEGENPASLAGYRNGYGQNEDEVLAEICETQPDVVFVALGIPRQELLLDSWYDRLEKGVLVGVGGSFDVLSGYKKRAPKFFLRLNCEWLYRILKEPKRMRRFWTGSVSFVFRVRRIKKQMR
ncbi:MAG: WecB/TagA/CpsF family glycosyltransferase [Clostridia bacterium]|nr:WecB/TagA/CpsF family glycosyltransferase [Clostridia bacterium]